MTIEGKVHRYGSDVNTDVIIPARYLNMDDPDQLAAHCMEDIDADFVKKVKPGDIIVAEYNFGCGSSREHAPIAIKASGVGAVVAKNFARIFYRNAINIGLPILQCPQAVDGATAGDEMEIDLGTGVVRNVTRGAEYRAEPFPEFMQRLIAAGGLINYAKERLGVGM